VIGPRPAWLPARPNPFFWIAGAVLIEGAALALAGQALKRPALPLPSRDPIEAVFLPEPAEPPVPTAVAVEPPAPPRGVHIVSARPRRPRQSPVKIAARPSPQTQHGETPAPAPTENVSGEEGDLRGPPGIGTALETPSASGPTPITRPPEPIPGEQPLPVLPDDLRTRDFSGQALILFQIDTQGNAEPHLLRSTGNARIDGLALDAARCWRFHPALREGRPVADQFQVEMDINVR
jgi:TonB family protein